MQVFTVTSIFVGFEIGAILALDANQAARRAHNIRPLLGDPATLQKLVDDLGEEVCTAIASYCGATDRQPFEVVRAVQFKRGEEVAVIRSGSLNKAFLQNLAPAESDAARAVVAAVAEAVEHGNQVKADRAAGARDLAAVRAAGKGAGTKSRRAEGKLNRAEVKAVKAAMLKLDPADVAHWTLDGKPNAQVLGEKVGFVVSGDNRDAIFAAMVKAKAITPPTAIAGGGETDGPNGGNMADGGGAATNPGLI